MQKNKIPGVCHHLRPHLGRLRGCLGNLWNWPSLGRWSLGQRPIQGGGIYVRMLDVAQLHNLFFFGKKHALHMPCQSEIFKNQRIFCEVEESLTPYNTKFYQLYTSDTHQLVQTVWINKQNLQSKTSDFPTSSFAWRAATFFAEHIQRGELNPKMSHDFRDHGIKP